MLEVDVRFHVFFSDLTNPDLEDEDVHIAILFTLAHSLLRRYAGAELRFVFENADKRLESFFGSALARAAEFLDSSESGRGVPRATALAKIGRKPLGGIAAADYAIGIANLDLGQTKEPPFEEDRRSLQRIAPHIAHIMNFDKAIHRKRFDMVENPSWARHIVGASSHSGVDGAYPSLIPDGSTGPFSFWDTTEQLATGLGYTPEAFEAVCDKARMESSYALVPVKIKGKVRRFTVAVDESVRDLQKRLSYVLNQFASQLHVACCAYVPGRGAVDAATPHVGNQWAQRLDIQDFFDATSSAVVQETLKRLHASQEVSEVLSSILTFNGALPTGARTSPMMSNLVLSTFDYEIAHIAKNGGLSYSRYADDLIFSGDNKFDVSADVSRKLLPLGLKLNPAKTRLKRQGQPFRVAGLTIDAGGPRVQKKFKRKLRLQLYLLDTALRAIADVPANARGAVTELDRADQLLFERTRGLSRYCVGVEFEWTMTQVSKFPYAEAAIWVAKRPEARAASVQRLAARIRSAQSCHLTDELQQVGAAQPLETLASVVGRGRVKERAG